jgi:hypothetical protein
VSGRLVATDRAGGFLPSVLPAPVNTAACEGDPVSAPYGAAPEAVACRRTARRTLARLKPCRNGARASAAHHGSRRMDTARRRGWLGVRFHCQWCRTPMVGLQPRRFTPWPSRRSGGSVNRASHCWETVMTSGAVCDQRVDGRASPTLPTRALKRQFLGCAAQNASRINGRRSQIFCSVDLPPFFDDG